MKCGLIGTRLKETALEYQREIDLLNRERKLNQVTNLSDIFLYILIQHFYDSTFLRFKI